MNPYEIDPKVNYRRIHELSDEFTLHWNRLHGFYLDAAVGFLLVRRLVETDQARARELLRGSDLDSEEFQDTRMFSYSQMFSESFCASAIHRATQGEAKQRNQIDGANFTLLGQLCIVSFYDFWNDYLRHEYVIAKGHLDPKETDAEVIKAQLKRYASHDLWGDLRNLRQSMSYRRFLVTA